MNHSAETEAGGESSVMHMHTVVHFVFCLLSIKEVCMQKSIKQKKNEEKTQRSIESAYLLTLTFG